MAEVPQQEVERQLVVEEPLLVARLRVVALLPEEQRRVAAQPLVAQPALV